MRVRDLDQPNRSLFFTKPFPVWANTPCGGLSLVFSLLSFFVFFPFTLFFQGFFVPSLPDISLSSPFWWVLAVTEFFFFTHRLTIPPFLLNAGQPNLSPTLHFFLLCPFSSSLHRGAAHYRCIFLMRGKFAWVFCPLTALFLAFRFDGVVCEQGQLRFSFDFVSLPSVARFAAAWALLLFIRELLALVTPKTLSHLTVSFFNFFFF